MIEEKKAEEELKEKRKSLTSSKPEEPLAETGKEEEEMRKGDQSSIVDDERNDGGGTGGVGMFSMTMGEDELIGDAHMASNNPFGMEEDDDLPEINEDGFEEIKLKEKADRESVVTVSNVNVAHNIDS